MMNVKRNITILDTTLRDGDQSPGMAFNMDEKIEIALILEKLGVDIIEAGFPASSKVEFEIVREVASRNNNSVISVMARSIPGDIDKAVEAVKYAVKKQIHLTIPTSPIHRKFKQIKSMDEIIALAVSSIQYAKPFVNTIEIGAEDATRTEVRFLTEFCKAVTEAGANTVNIPDTVGYAQPFEFSKLIKTLIRNVPAFANGTAKISVHCHNDLGMATANTLSGITAGAMQIEATLLGIGERAGNAALEEVVTAIQTRPQYYPVITKINSGLFPEAARIISRANAIRPHPCKPVVGSNVNLHSSGIHQHGMALNNNAYSIINSNNISLTSGFVLSGHSGIKGMTEKIKRIAGIDLPVELAEKLFICFKEEADRKKNISCTDLLLLLYDMGIVKNTIWKLKKIYYFNSKSSDRQEFSVFLELIDQEGNEKWVNESNATKWTAIKKALRSAFHFDIRIIDFSSSFFADDHIISERFRLETEFEGVFYVDESFGSDSLILFVESYLDIINQITARYQFADSK
jgi:2-isopropylmalate synthase